ncbi:hypothetical protein BGX26_006407 [Mortierella sp. AD094]|nr:hypothetical protein BGX26_006407 [Mortierella sp. AD094]
MVYPLNDFEGGIMTMGPSILPAFEQLSLLENLETLQNTEIVSCRHVGAYDHRQNVYERSSSVSYNTSYEGDIIIGDDGAYGGTRQSLYKRLEKDGLLPTVDLEKFSIGYTLMVSIADPKDPEKFPERDDPIVAFPFAIGGDFKNLQPAAGLGMGSSTLDYLGMS